MDSQVLTSTPQSNQGDEALRAFLYPNETPIQTEAAGEAPATPAGIDNQNGIETPSAEIPVVENKDGEGTPQAQDYTSFLSEAFGDAFKSVEELKAANIPSKLKELETAQARLTELEAELSSTKESPFANDKVAKYNQLLKTNPDFDFGLFNKVESIDLKTASPIEVLKLQFILDHPEYQGKDSMIEKSIGKRFSYDPTISSETHSPEDVEENEMAKMQMTIASKDAVKSIEDFKSKIVVPESAVTKPLTERRAEAEKNWTPLIDKTIASMNEITIKTGVDKGENYKIQISAADVKDMADLAKKVAIDQGLSMDENGLATVKSIIEGQYILGNITKILDRVRTETMNNAIEKSAVEKHNPSGVKRGDTPPPATPKSDTSKEMFDAIDRAMRGR